MMCSPHLCSAFGLEAVSLASVTMGEAGTSGAAEGIATRAKGNAIRMNSAADVSVTVTIGVVPVEREMCFLFKPRIFPQSEKHNENE